jgi:hypothetical protein
MTVYGKHGKRECRFPPFPQTLEIDETDSHIPSATSTTASLTEIKTRKEPSPVRPTFAPFRLIVQLEKTETAGLRSFRYSIDETDGWNGGQGSGRILERTQP